MDAAAAAAATAAAAAAAAAVTVSAASATSTTAVTTANPAINVTASSAPMTRYCDDLVAFRTMYSPVHGYVSLLVCAFGCVANALNIAVLTRREMASPTNSILTGLALADLLVMLEYVPYALHMYLLGGQARPLASLYSYPWACFVLFHANFTQVCHTVSIWLTVTLAVWRYIAVAHPQRNREWCKRETTIMAIVSAYLLSPLLCVPHYMAFTIVPHTAPVDENGYKVTNVSLMHTNVTFYLVGMSEVGGQLLNINFWTYSVLIKLLPCAALTVLSLRLVCALLEAKKRRATLAGQGALRPPRRSADKTDRTTRMLLAVLLLFLATELPQGLLGLMSQLLGPDFFVQCYSRLGELMDFLALLNSAINFILYCTMSRQFRTTFSVMFRPRVLDRWLPVPQGLPLSDNNGNTNNMTQIVNESKRVRNEEINGRET